MTRTILGDQGGKYYGRDIYKEQVTCIVVRKYTRRINGEPRNHLLITKPAPELST